VLATILLPIIAASVYMASVQQRNVALSQNWNSAVPIVEAGIEEAFAHLNRDCFSNAINLGVVDWQAGGWTHSNSVFYLPRRTFADNSYYDVQIITNGTGVSESASDKMPHIICAGGVPARFGVRTYSTNSFLSRPSSAPLFATLEVDRSTNANFIKRQVRVVATRWNWTDFGVLGDCGVNMNGRGDLRSFDSAGGSSFFGRYNTDYATDSARIGSARCNVNLGPNSDVYGSIETSPDGGASGGSVGSSNWVAGGNAGIETNHYSNNLDVTVPSVTAPDGATSWPSLGICTINCTRSFTLLASDTNVYLYNQTNYPSPIPPGGVHTNFDGYFSSSIYYSNTPGPPYTNFYTTNLAQPSVPVNGVAFATNYPGATWQSNTAANVTVAAGGPPGTNYFTSGVSGESAVAGYYSNLAGVFWFTRQTNWLTQCDYNDISSDAYVGNLVYSNKVNCSAGAKKTNYVYSHIWKKMWKEVSVTNYDYYTTTYFYNTYTFDYWGRRTTNETVTYTYKYIAEGGDYYSTGIALSGGAKMLVTGANRIYVNGNLSTSGQSQIVMAPGASLEIYMNGNVSLMGNGIMNTDGRAYQLMIYGLDGCTDIQVGGNAQLIAGILAPHADITFNGGGSRGLFVGAVAGASVTFNGDFDMGYDQDLARHLPPVYFTPSDWSEEIVSIGAAP
jgi:hypothetical protein